MLYVVGVPCDYFCLLSKLHVHCGRMFARNYHISTQISCEGCKYVRVLCYLLPLGHGEDTLFCQIGDSDCMVDSRSCIAPLLLPSTHLGSVAYKCHKQIIKHTSFSCMEKREHDSCSHLGVSGCYNCIYSMYA